MTDSLDRPPDMQGRRIEYGGDGIPESGCYWRDARDGNWYGMTPNGHLAGMANHQVTEHEDGTITVSPSILVASAHRDEWHGYLERGFWRQV